MRVLVVGATGLIGGTIVARLIEAGCEVVGIARRTAAATRSIPAAQWITLDIAAAKRPEVWFSCLTGIDAVVNCAGVLQDSPYESTRAVHVEGVTALFSACERLGVRHVVQFSAIGVDREAPTPFSQSKIEGDRALMKRDLDWVILRPSVVVGAAAYGGSALFRGLAALPLLPVMPETGLLQPVQLDDVAETVLLCLALKIPPRSTLELAGPDRLSVVEIVRLYRHWLGWGEPRMVPLPGWAAALLYWLGDFAGWLGWRPPMRSTARREIVRGAVGDPSAWMRVSGIAPKPLSAALAAHPASVQERWFSRIYFLKPIAFAVLSLFWLITGLIALGPGYRAGAELMHDAGAGTLSSACVIAGAVTDIVIGIAIALRRTARTGLYVALAVSVFYTIAATAITPWLWLDPLGPLVKIAPIVVLTVVALAILEDR
jgi:uncharacterized protein YbjT (DUF2867 family)